MEVNNLYPIFLKTKNLHVLIIGGGFVAEEKLTFLLKSSPDANVLMVSPMFREGTKALAKKGNVQLVYKKYHRRYLKGKHIVVATTDLPEVNEKVYKDCRRRSILVNVADNPPFCDFYMGFCSINLVLAAFRAFIWISGLVVLVLVVSPEMCS